ncbi:PREDICTED: F-box protein SKIP19-like [Camelina sativa]|uniref:F-box protein SKIP19-like n=1 Tax=Camelina sativa TaxID=90675 RepID=A0ABM0VGN8_CAMSA|nr:PREDICTED: F-box protein SKIP19-like [Camelina sativa]
MSAPSSTLVPPLMIREEEEPRNWAELPSDLMSSILLRLGAVEILENAQKVCTSWRRICKDPTMWQKIDMRDLGNRRVGDLDFEILCRHAVDLSQGGLLEIHLDVFATNELISYVHRRKIKESDKFWTSKDDERRTCERNRKNSIP